MANATSLTVVVEDYDGMRKDGPTGWDAMVVFGGSRPVEYLPRIEGYLGETIPVPAKARSGTGHRRERMDSV